MPVPQARHDLAGSHGGPGGRRRAGSQRPAARREFTRQLAHTVDLERIATLRGTKLLFPSEGNWRYKLELSDDGENGWKLLADETRTTSVAKERADVVKSMRGRFLRVSITAAPAGQLPALAELEITGDLSSL